MTDGVVFTDPPAKVRFSSMGMRVTGDLSKDEWVVVGQRIVQIINGSTWALGDWIAYGQGRGDYGESYQTAIVITGRTYDSLSQAARVSLAFPYASRTAKVPWSHYREALRLPEAERHEMLLASAENRWSRDRFSQEIESLLATLNDRPVKAVYQVDHHAKKTGPRQNRPMKCPNCGHEWTARVKRPSGGAGVKRPGAGDGV